MKAGRATVCLPVKNRVRSHSFYTALGFATAGELADDGVPEPLQLEVSAGLRVMLVPTRGFGWLLGNHRRSPSNTHECVIVVGRATETDVDNLMRRAKDAGGKIVTPAGRQTWGYVGAFADPDGHIWQVSQIGGVLLQ